MSEIVFAVITVSDTCHQDATKDRSGPRLVQLLTENFDNCRVLKEILPDEQDLITQKLKQLVALEAQVSCILTTGGTGFAPRDVTPEATKAVIDKECPQLAMALAIHSLQKTKFAALSRSVCGIAGKTLILNFPGSEKAVVECFDYVKDLLPHALHLLNNELALVKKTHEQIQNQTQQAVIPPAPSKGHICPHKTGKGDDNDRNSPFPMLPVNETLNIILQTIKPQATLPQLLKDFKSPVDIPPFRASIKDGYVMKSSGFSGSKKVLGYIAAGDSVIETDFQEDECYKINTGAPVPLKADCVIQVEDTKLLKTKKNGLEDLVEILVEPKKDLDIRPIGCDLAKGSSLFPSVDLSPVVVKSLMASVGHAVPLHKPLVAVISTGSELLDPQDYPIEGKIYDSNTTMLKQLLQYFGFDCVVTKVLTDNFDEVYETLTSIYDEVDFVICSGGVSMGDKDYIKPVLQKLGFNLQVGRVNMKPGKPMTFASKDDKYFFGLPGNPVSAFVCFHMFSLPAIRWASGWTYEKCMLPVVQVTLQNPNVALDPRPEYMRATITSKNGQLYATITGNQMSSRLQSIVGADVLVHLPARTATKTEAHAGDILPASVLRYDFITKYE
ncbi:molybdenum cofactor synthesis protein cinnamon [Lucilia sericata]|uniref:molybdenum cofactor synthesis protein cinnamon n=1 Tax=Lucilia sericata TaxID=13632 RepID=UPI0018A851E3|nr:molybdenum cofactor synthesis protein cinnamon [Lucilia sericata]